MKWNRRTACCTLDSELAYHALLLLMDLANRQGKHAHFFVLAFWELRDGFRAKFNDCQEIHLVDRCQLIVPFLVLLQRYHDLMPMSN